MNKRDTQHEEAELDRRIDLINVVFGAALGAYVGDILGQASLSGHRGLVLAVALVVLVCLLIAIRNLIHVIKGTHKGSWRIPLFACVGGLVFFYAIRGDTFLDLSALIPVVLGWAGAFFVILAAHFLTRSQSQ